MTAILPALDTSTTIEVPHVYFRELGGVSDADWAQLADALHRVAVVARASMPDHSRGAVLGVADDVAEQIDRIADLFER